MAEMHSGENISMLTYTIFRYSPILAVDKNCLLLLKRPQMLRNIMETHFMFGQLTERIQLSTADQNSVNKGNHLDKRGI